jgi:chromosome segregation ATPase
MIRMLARWAPTLAALGILCMTARAEDPNGVLAGKGLRAVGSTYVLGGEDRVKKASDAVEARLKEYRRAAALEKYSVRDEAGRKALAADLTKQRAALGKEMDQTLPQVNAQVRALSQQQSQLRQQMNGLQYGTSNITTMAHNTLVAQHNGLTEQIEALQAQGGQMVAAYDEMGEQIRRLESPADSPGPAAPAADKSRQAGKAPAPSAEQARDAYLEALAALRKAVDATRQGYEALAGDDGAKAALASLNKRSPRIKYTLGPTRKFLDAVKALEQAEAKGADVLPEETKPAAVKKRKARPSRGR